MDETYTCVCGGQKFTIQDGTITCSNCGMIYQLQWLDKDFNPEFESPGNFNSRIRSQDGIKE